MSALTLLFTGLTGRDLFGKYRGWSAAIILIGCLGLLIHAHLLVTDLALLAGIAMMLYGYTLALRFRLRAGIFIGIGVGIGFMSKGFIAIILFLLISALLLAFRNWRNRPYYLALGIAVLCAAALAHHLALAAVRTLAATVHRMGMGPQHRALDAITPSTISAMKPGTTSSRCPGWPGPPGRWPPGRCGKCGATCATRRPTSCCWSASA